MGVGSIAIVGMVYVCVAAALVIVQPLYKQALQTITLEKHIREKMSTINSSLYLNEVHTHRICMKLFIQRQREWYYTV